MFVATHFTVSTHLAFSLVPRPTNSHARIGLAQFESFLGCTESAVLKLGKPIRLLERRKT